MMPTKIGNRAPEFDHARVRDISEAVYRDRLGPDDTASMIRKDGDGGKKLRERAGSYDTLTRAYLRVLQAKGGDDVRSS